MRRIAIIFDHFGNPNQPFLLEWYRRLINSRALSIQGFTDKVYGHQRFDEILVFKVSGLGKLKRYIAWRVRSLVDRHLRSIPHLHSSLAVFRPDVIHIQNAQQLSVYKEVLGRTNAKLIVSFRGYETSVRPFKDVLWKEALLDIYKKADVLHFVSDFLKQEAIRLGAPEKKCVVIRRSVDIAFFSPDLEKVTSNVVNLLAVGRLTWQKGYSHLLESAYVLKTEGYDFRLEIIGDGPEKEQLQETVEIFGLCNHVVFKGHVDRNSLRDAYRKADVFVQASVSDALPNSVLEASACGLPIVSTTAGGIPEAVRDGCTGMLVTPGDAKVLTGALRKVIGDSYLRRTMGANGRLHIEDQFSASSEAAMWERFYNCV